MLTLPFHPPSLRRIDALRPVYRQEDLARRVYIIMLTIETCHYEHNGQRKTTKYTVPQVDKGTSLHCYIM